MFNVRLRDNSCMERCCCQNMLFQQLTIYRTFPVDMFKKFPLGRHGKTNICLYCLASIVTKLIIYIHIYIYIHIHTASCILKLMQRFCADGVLGA